MNNKNIKSTTKPTIRADKNSEAKLVPRNIWESCVQYMQDNVIQIAENQQQHNLNLKLDTIYPSTFAA